MRWLKVQFRAYYQLDLTMQVVNGFWDRLKCFVYLELLKRKKFRKCFVDFSQNRLPTYNTLNCLLKIEAALLFLSVVLWA